MGSLYKRTYKTLGGTVHERPTWWLKYYQNGRAIRESTGTTKETVARRMLRLREGDVERGIPVNPKLGRLTFEEAATDIQTEYRVNGRRSLRHLERRIRLHLDPLTWPRAADRHQHAPQHLAEGRTHRGGATPTVAWLPAAGGRALQRAHGRGPMPGGLRLLMQSVPRSRCPGPQHRLHPT